MSEESKVAAAEEFNDKLIPALKNVVKSRTEADAILEKFGAGLTSMATNGKSLAASLDKAAESAKKLGGANGFGAVSGQFEKMAKASAEIARNMAAAQKAGAEVGSAIHLHTSGGDGGDKKSVANTIKDKAKEGVKAVGDKLGDQEVDTIKSDADLEQINSRIIKSMPGPEKPGALQALRARETDLASLNAGKGNIDIGEIAKAIELGKNELYRLPQAVRDGITNTTIPLAANLASSTGMKFDEIHEGLIDVIKNGQVETEEEGVSVAKAVALAANSTKIGTGQIGKDLESVAEPWEHAGENRESFALLIAQLRKSDLMTDHTASAIKDIFATSLPKILSDASASDRKKIKAGKELGLYDDDKQARFYDHGQVDVAHEFEILAKAKNDIKNDSKFSALLNDVFGKDASRLNEHLNGLGKRSPKLDFIGRLHDMPQDRGVLDLNSKPATELEKYRQIASNVEVTMMNSVAVFHDTASMILDRLLSSSDKAVSFSAEHPMMAAGLNAAMVGGAIGGPAYLSMKVVKGALKKIFGKGAPVAEGAVEGVAEGTAEGVAEGAIATEGAGALTAAGAIEGAGVLAEVGAVAEMGALAAAATAALPIVAGVAALAAGVAGMAWLLSNVIDPDTDDKQHPGKRRRHVRGHSDIWEVDPSLSQEHAGEHYVRGGRSGSWVKDTAADIANEHPVDQTSHVPHWLSSIFGGTSSYVSTGRSHPGVSRNALSVEPPKTALASPPMPPKVDAAIVPSAENGKMKELMSKAEETVKQAINVSVYLDSKQISSYLLPSIAHGPSGFNGTAAPMRS